MNLAGGAGSSICRLSRRFAGCTPLVGPLSLFDAVPAEDGTSSRSELADFLLSGGSGLPVKRSDGLGCTYNSVGARPAEVGDAEICCWVVALEDSTARNFAGVELKKPSSSVRKGLCAFCLPFPLSLTGIATGAFDTADVAAVDDAGAAAFDDDAALDEEDALLRRSCASKARSLRKETGDRGPPLDPDEVTGETDAPAATARGDLLTPAMNF